MIAGFLLKRGPSLFFVFCFFVDWVCILTLALLAYLARTVWKTEGLKLPEGAV
jgi:hypothetical protein